MSRHKIVSRNNKSKLPVVPIGEGLFDLEELMQGLELDMRSFASSAGLQVMKQLIDREVTVLAGKRHSQDTDNNRWCHQKGSVIIGGQRQPIVWQRVRTRDGKEVPVTSYKAFHRNDARTKAVYDRLVAGVSCRDYASTVEAITDGYGISRSVASREMIRATAKDLKELVERDLSTLDIRVILIDGIRLAERVMIVAVGVSSGGNKQILGFREGATENSRVCVELFQDLVRRGLAVDGPMLVVIDGSTALRSAVDKFFGDNAIVQRCQHHKREDLKKYLPQNYHAEVVRKLQAAYSMTTYDNAHQALRRLVNELGRINVSAANSLEEGLEETLSMHRLELPEILRKSFSTTNLIESAFSHSRKVMRNVKRWSNSEQAHRWMATALQAMEKRFRRMKGYRIMPMLVNGLNEEVKRRSQAKSFKVA